jgi:hypothetical protein
MPVPDSMDDLSTTAASNTPAGSESPTNADDYLRAIQAILRSTNAKGSDIASAATTNLGTATGEFVDVTGTTTITSFGTIAAGIVRTVRFTGALTLTHNATSLILPGGANITTAANDTAIFRSLGSGNWLCVAYKKADGNPVIAQLPVTDATAVVKGSSDATKLIRLEADGITTATTRVITMPDFDVNLGITGNAEDTTPDQAADYVATYDASAGGLKKVLLGRVGAWTYLAEQASTSGTSIDFTGIPSWATEVEVMFVGVSTNGTSDWIMQIGDAGGIETTGYLGAANHLGAANTVSNYTAGYGLNPSATAGSIVHGSIKLSLEDSSDNTWVATGNLARSDGAAVIAMAGSKPLSATFTQLRITTAGGANTFDAGVIRARYR